MSRITDYPSLCQAIVDFSHRPSLKEYCDYFIQDGEDRLYRKILEMNEGMGLKYQETMLSGTIDGNGYLVVPSDYLALKNAQVVTSGGTYDLDGKEPQWIYGRYPMRSPQGIPAYIAREGANFIFGPFPDNTYQVLGQYYSRAAALSASQATTWMTDNIPFALLAACMVSVAKFLKDPESAQAQMAELTDRLTDIVAADKAERYAAGSLQISADSSFP